MRQIGILSPRKPAWRLTALAASAALLLTSFGAFVPAALAAGTVNWPTYLMDNARDGYNGNETVITPSSAPNLKLHWSDQTGGSISTQPVVAGGLVYWGSWDGNEYAASSTTGQVAWQTFLGKVSDANCFPSPIGLAGTGTVASVPINGASRSVLLVGGGGNVDANGNPVANPQAAFFALDSLTGQALWSTPLGASPGTFVWSSPAYVNASAYVGLASLCDIPLVQGKVVKLDAATGAVQATFPVVPAGCTGGGVWGSPTIDEAQGTLYVATGNPGACGVGEAYAEAVVELRLADLSVVGSWQVPGKSQIVDGDFGSTPTLFSGKVRGKSTPLVGVANKNGTYYAFQRDAVSAGPVWAQPTANPAAGPTGGGGASISPSAFDGTTLYVAGGATTLNGAPCGGSVRALNPGTGRARWQLCLPAAVLGAVSAVPGLVVIGQQSPAGGAQLDVINASTGGILFAYPPGGANFYGAPSIANGLLYIGDVSGKLSALGP